MEYYIQLLKTVILKMRGHASLIKLFCNNRYSSFPLLYQVTYLAVCAQEELVKITAQQCVLLLVNLLNSRGVGRGYLCELQMAVFYHEVTLGIARSESDVEGGLKYLIDLLVALQNNRISLEMLMNAFVLNVILRKRERVWQVLEVVRRFLELMLECAAFPRQLY